MLEKGADIAVVGRGIVAAKSPEAEVLIYKKTLWQYYEQRVSAKEIWLSFWSIYLYSFLFGTN